MNSRNFRPQLYCFYLLDKFKKTHKFINSFVAFCCRSCYKVHHEKAVKAARCHWPQETRRPPETNPSLTGLYSTITTIRYALHRLFLASITNVNKTYKPKYHILNFVTYLPLKRCRYIPFILDKLYLSVFLFIIFHSVKSIFGGTVFSYNYENMIFIDTQIFFVIFYQIKMSYLAQYWADVGPTSLTMGHQPNSGSNPAIPTSTLSNGSIVIII